MNMFWAVIHKESGSVFGISFPDFPGCVAGGDSAEAAVAAGREALAGHVETMLDEGEVLPEPCALDDLLADPDWNDGAFVQVEGPRPKGKHVRVQVTIDEHLLADIDCAAAQEGTSRSGYLSSAATYKMGLRYRSVRLTENGSLVR